MSIAKLKELALSASRGDPHVPYPDPNHVLELIESHQELLRAAKLASRVLNNEQVLFYGNELLTKKGVIDAITKAEALQ